MYHNDNADEVLAMKREMVPFPGKCILIHHSLAISQRHALLYNRNYFLLLKILHLSKTLD